ncbi:MAG: DUF2723 domain-containing protein [bacterium]
MIPDPQTRRWADGAATILAALVPLVVYLRTLAPTVYGLDSAELTTGAYLLGVVHSPGSPLFLLLGHVFTWLPFGDVGYRVNLLSACSAAVAVAFVFLAVRQLTGERLLALGTAWYLAFSYYFWGAAVAAELYALHALFVALLLWLALRWRDELSLARVSAFAVLFGLGLGNHLSLCVLAPGYVWLLASGRGQAWRRGRWWLAGLVGALAGASIYLYLPLRADSPMNYARDYGIDVTTWGGFWAAVSGRMFASHYFAVPVAQLPGEVLGYAHRLWSNFLGLGCLVGIAGLVADFDRRRDVHLGLILLFFGHLSFMLTYDVPDREVMLVPTYLIWALWTAIGVRALADAVTPRRASRASAPATTAAVLMLAMSATNLVVNFADADISDDWSARVQGEAIFASLPPGAVFIGAWYDVPILEYLRWVEGRRPDIETVNLFFLPRGGEADVARRHLRAGRAVFTSAPSTLLADDLAFEPDADCACARVVLLPDLP